MGELDGVGFGDGVFLVVYVVFVDFEFVEYVVVWLKDCCCFEVFDDIVYCVVFGVNVIGMLMILLNQIVWSIVILLVGWMFGICVKIFVSKVLSCMCVN